MLAELTSASKAAIVTLFSFSALQPALRAEEWSPPSEADPGKILDEARADAAARRYKDALAKYVWFYEKALTYQETLIGVRNAYAVREWRELGKVYPPALTKLLEARDAAAKNVTTGGDPKLAFTDVAAINRALDDDGHTCKLFLHLHAEEPKTARQVYRHAQEALIRNKEYKVCSKYLDLKEAVPSLKKSVQTVLVTIKAPDLPAEARPLIKKVLINDCATFIALLAINERHDEARSAAGDLRKAWEDAEFHIAIDKALKGQLPER